MFNWLTRKTRKAVVKEPTFVVQLHIKGVDPFNSKESTIVYSYAPIVESNLGDARYRAHCLKIQNRWGNATRWPHITIHDDEGVWFPEDRNCIIRQSDGKLVKYNGP